MKALENVKILDFTTLLPGPYATMVLADFGAEVIKISSKSKHDLVLEAEPKVEGISQNQLWLNRNKSTISLNLKSKEAVEIVKELAKDADVVVEQFRPGVMKSLGLSYEDIKEVNPEIIYCSITGYGQDGPMANRAGHDINFLAKSGILASSGRKEEGPVLYSTQLGDLASGASNAIIGILLALNYKNKTGKGQYIDISMMDGLIPLNSLYGNGYLGGGALPTPEGDFLNGGSCYDFYRTKDDRFISVGSLEPKFWQIFTKAIDREDLKDKSAYDASIKEEIKSRIKEKTFKEWMDIFNELDACVEGVLNLKEVLEDPHTKGRGMVIEFKVKNTTNKQFANPIKLSKTPAAYDHPGKEIGIDTEKILKSLNYTDEEIKEMEERDVFK